MSKDKKKDTEPTIKKVRRHADELHSDIRYVTQGTIEGSKNTIEYAVATDQGLFFYLFKNDKLTPLANVLWPEVKEIKVDYLAMRTNLTLNGQNYRLTNEGKKIFELAQEKSEAKVQIVSRKWHQKILGFRSGTRWKKIVAVAVYLLLFGFIGSMFVEDEEKALETETKVKQEASSTEQEADKDEAVAIPPKQSDSEKDTELETEDPPNKEEAAKVEEPAAELTLSEQVEAIVIDKLGNETNMSKERIISIDDISDNADGSYFVLVLNGNENFTSNLTKRGLQLDASEILEPISQIPEIKKVVLQWFLPLIDVSGNEVDTQVMIINIEKEALDQINWDNFDVGNFEAVSETYFEHAALKE